MTGFQNLSGVTTRIVYKKGLKNAKMLDTGIKNEHRSNPFLYTIPVVVL